MPSPTSASRNGITSLPCARAEAWNARAARPETAADRACVGARERRGACRCHRAALLLLFALGRLDCRASTTLPSAVVSERRAQGARRRRRSCATALVPVAGRSRWLIVSAIAGSMSQPSAGSWSGCEGEAVYEAMANEEELEGIIGGYMSACWLAGGGMWVKSDRATPLPADNSRQARDYFFLA